MRQIGIFYGSSTGNTEAAALAIAKALQTLPGVSVDVLEISRKTVEKLSLYPQLILGVPTWDIGQLQDDWANVVPTVRQMDLTGKVIALFGCGDQYCYPDSYQDAIGLMAQLCRAQGATLVGRWPTTDYEFDDSLALEDEMFLGLALDDNQKELTPARIQQWVEQLIQEFDLTAVAVAV
ncbi:MAG: flavodoxin [Caldilineaceae bacterium]|nr:flavodoxin [Caldilineaceae bacterium]